MPVRGCQGRRIRDRRSASSGSEDAGRRGSGAVRCARGAFGGSLTRVGPMPELIESPVRVDAAGEPPKTIEEFAGRARNGENRVSVARMSSPAGWAEPGQRPDFDEYSVVLTGALRIEDEGGTEMDVRAGQAVLVRAGEWVRYSTPEGAEYVAVCLPAFSPETVNRDA